MRSPPSEVIRILNSKENIKLQVHEFSYSLPNVWNTAVKSNIFGLRYVSSGKEKKTLHVLQTRREFSFRDVVTLKGYKKVKHKTRTFWKKFNSVWNTNSRHEF
jgi:hypothetical protein